MNGDKSKAQKGVDVAAKERSQQRNVRLRPYIGGYILVSVYSARDNGGARQPVVLDCI